MKDKFAKLNYAQLKEMFPSTQKIKKLPKARELRGQKIKKVHVFSGLDFTIELFSNGLYIYTRGERTTTYAVDRCGKIVYQFKDGRSVVTDNQYGNCKWYIPLVIKAEERIEESIRTTEIKKCDYHLNDFDYENSLELSVNPEEKIKEINEKLKYQKKVHQTVKSMLGTLTEKQRQVVTMLLKYNGITQKEIAKELGVTPAAVTQRLTTAIKNLKKIYKNF